MLLSSRDDPHGAVRQGPAPRRRDAPHGSDGCASPILRPTKKSLTLGSPVGTLPAMGAVIRTGLRSDRPGRRVETSCSRFLPCATNSASWLVRRGAFAQLTVCLAVFAVVVAPMAGSAGADPARHCRTLASPKVVHRCWRRRLRSPGRPRIDSPCRDLIRRLAAENCLWGAPRIHGELPKLGITISERTVSRYLHGRPTTRSQAWRTFFANLLGGQTFISPVMIADAHADDIVVDASNVSFRQFRRSIRRAPPFTEPASIGAVRSSRRTACVSVTMTFRTVQHRTRTAAVTRRGTYRCNQPRGVRAGFLSCAPTAPLRPTAVREHLHVRAWP
jgi:hypothetical protein